jgi:hypothetical protein
MKYAADPANRDPLDNLAVETLIDKLLVSHNHANEEDRIVEMSKKVTQFWVEHANFVNKQGIFARKHIWIAAADEKVLMHEWHAMHSHPFTEVLGPLACIVGSKPLGIGQAERNWKIYKRNKDGQRSRLGTGKTKSQTVIAGAYSHQKSAARRVQAQRAGKVWTDDDFVFLKLDNYCTGSITESIVKPVRVVRLYKEAWECVQFDSKGDDIHAARLSAKYGGLKYIDTEEPHNHGVIPSIGCVVLSKCSKESVEKKIVGKGWYYGILGCYDGFVDDVAHCEQSPELYDIWQRDWTFYEMIDDYYKQFPDPKTKIQIVTGENAVGEDDDGGGKQRAK